MLGGNAPQLTTFVAETSCREVIGYSCYSYMYNSMIGKCMYLQVVYVQEEYRNKRIGFHLLQTVIRVRMLISKLRSEQKSIVNDAFGGRLG